MRKCPAARLQIFQPRRCRGVSSGKLGVEPASDLLPSHELVIVSPSHVWGDYIQLLCKAQQVQTCTSNQLFQLSAGICLATAVQNTMFPNTDAALMSHNLDLTEWTLERPYLVSTYVIWITRWCLKSLCMLQQCIFYFSHPVRRECLTGHVSHYIFNLHHVHNMC